MQYLHQIGQLSIIPAIVGSIIVPPAVLVELDAGIAKGLDLPQPEILKWVRIQAPISAKAASLITDLGPGESQVLMLALEMPGSVALLDDALARRVAIARPSLDKLQELGFRLAHHAQDAVLKLAGEYGIFAQGDGLTRRREAAKSR